MPAVPEGATLTLRARGDGPIDLMSLFAIRDAPGVTYSNLGTIGAKIDEIFRLDPITMRAELARLHPALILIAFGTNEGFDEKTDTTGYGDVYGRAVRLVRENAPWASIALVGPPDGNRAVGNHGTVGQVCPPPDGGRAENNVWAVPPHLPEVREAERRFAWNEGYFYWDWSLAMGGACTMQVFARTNPPMGSPDHVHLLKPGYRATAEKLFDALMADYGPPH